MDPVSEFVFTFDTRDDITHPDFVLENLTEKGPVFLAFRADVCSACEIMEPILMDMFNIEFGKKELFYEIINFGGTDIVFYHINIDDPYERESEAFYIYGKIKFFFVKNENSKLTYSKLLPAISKVVKL